MAFWITSTDLGKRRKALAALPAEAPLPSVHRRVFMRGGEGGCHALPSPGHGFSFSCWVSLRVRADMQLYWGILTTCGVQTWFGSRTQGIFFRITDYFLQPKFLSFLHSTRCINHVQYCTQLHQKNTVCPQNVTLV